MSLDTNRKGGKLDPPKKVDLVNSRGWVCIQLYCSVEKLLTPLNRKRSTEGRLHLLKQLYRGVVSIHIVSNIVGDIPST